VLKSTGLTTKLTKGTKAYWGVLPIMIFVCFVFFVVKALSAGAFPQAAPQGTFRAGVDLVEVDVTVLDKERRPVRGLTAADFTVFEDGKERRVAAFTAVEVPASAPTVGDATWTRDAVSDVTTNALPEEGRLIVILMDRSIPDGHATFTARDIAKNAVREMGPNDVAAVVYSGGSGVPQNFTSDRGRLLASIDGAFAAGEISADGNANFDNLTGFLLNRSAVEGTGFAALNYSSECLCGSCVLETIGRIADAVRDVGRRSKSLLFIGRDIQVETVESICIDPVRKAREKMLTALDTSSVVVHTLDPGGLETPFTVGMRARGGGGYDGRPNLIRQGNIAVLPTRTGGRTVLNNNDPQQKVASIIHESDSYYLLGFVPGAPPDGKPHDIRVRVKRSGVDVRTRREYLAAPPAGARSSAPPAASATTAREGEALARRAILGLLPKRDNVTVTANIVTLANPETRAPVAAIALDVHHAATGAEPRALVPPAEQVDVVTSVLTLTGGMVGEFKQTLSIRPRPGAGGISYEVVQRLPIKPGQYEVRSGIYNEARRQTGSVYAFVEVPNYSTQTFALSDLLVHSPEGSVAGADTVRDIAGAAPTARRAFYRGETPVAIVRILQGQGAAAVPVVMTARIVDTSNRRVFGQEITLPAATFARTGVADYQLDLPLAGLESGQYLLTIDARGSLGTAQKKLRFTVR
jgi:VWFA-related protein